MDRARIILRVVVAVVVQRLNVPLNTLFIDHFGDDFYRPDEQTNSVRALTETSWSSRSGLNLTRTTPPPCYNNTTLGNCLYVRRKGPNVTNPICWNCKNCSYKCEHFVHSPAQSSSDNISSFGTFNYLLQVSLHY